MTLGKTDEDRSEPSGRHWALAGAVLAAILVILLGSGVAYVFEKSARQQNEIQARQLASAVAHDLGGRLDRSLSASVALAAVLRQGGGKIDHFSVLARELIEQFGGITALQLAPGGVISDVEPLLGNERVIGFSPLTDPVQGPETRLVVEQRMLGLTGPFDLRQGGVGVVGRNPVFIKGGGGKEEFWGLVQVLIRVPDLLSASKLDAIETAGYGFKLWRIHPGSREPHVFAQTSSRPLDDPVEIAIAVPNGEWVLSVAPEGGWYSWRSLLVYALAIGLLSLFASSLTYLVLRQPLLLRRRVAEQTLALRSSEEKYRELVELAASILIKWDKDGNIQFLNEYGLAFFGYAEDEIIGRPVVGTIVPLLDSSGKSLTQLMADIFDNPSAYESNINENMRKNGERVWIAWRNRVLRNQSGQAIGMFSVGIDMTDRLRIEEEKKEASEQLAIRNQWLRSVLEHFPGGVSVVDAEFGVVEYNHLFQELLAFPDALLKRPGVTLIDLIRFNAERGEYGNVDVDDYMQLAVKQLKLNVAHRFERTRPDGSVLEVRGTPLPDGGFVSSYVDVTERKQAEAELLALNARYEALNHELEERVEDRTQQLKNEIDERRAAEKALARNERMASLGGLVAGVAHEINTPIGNALMVSTTIQDRIRALARLVEEGQLRRSVLDGFVVDLRDSGNLIERNLHRAAELISNFKQVAVDQTSDRRRSFELAATLDEIRMTLAPRFQSVPQQLVLEAEPGILMDSYPGALGQIMTNLVENALLHAFAERQGGCLRVTARRDGASGVELVFADDGRGIPEEMQERVFDPFFTTRLGHGGSGLGLSIVLNLARDLLGGDIRMVSEEGRGTRFVLTIPCVAPTSGSVI